MREEHRRFWIIIMFASFTFWLASICLSAEVGIEGPETANLNESYFYTLDGVSEEDIAESKWACLPLSMKAEFELCLVYDPLTKERRPTIYFKPREAGKHTLIFDVNVQGKYGWALKEVLVSGSGSISTVPVVPGGPRQAPVTGWALWSKETAERVIPAGSRQEQANALAGSLETSIAASKDGAFSNAREFRLAMREANRKVIGEDGWAVWNSKFDSLLSQELSALAQQGKFDPDNQAALRDLYTEIAKGLRSVK